MQSNLNKSLLLFIIVGYITLSISTESIASNSVKFYDSLGYFSESDRELISKTFANEVKSEQNKRLYIIISTELDMSSFKALSINDQTNNLLHNFDLLSLGVSNCFVIVINPEQKQSEIIFKDSGVILDNTVIQNINDLFLTENLKEGEYAIPIAQAITFVIRDVERVINETKTYKQQEKDLDKYSNEFWIFIFLVVPIAIGYITLDFIKRYKSGHTYETRQFHAFDRLPSTTRKILSVLVIALLLVTQYYYLYYSGELVLSGIILIAVYQPVTNFIFYLFFVIKDWIKIKSDYGKVDSESISMVPALLLLKPEITCFELLGATFNALIFQEQIQLHIEWKQYRDGRERKYFRIEKGKAFDIKNSSSYEVPLLEPFRNLEMEYGYYLHQYIGLVNGHFTGFKYFKKGLVSAHLIDQGLLSKKEWIFNIYRPNQKGAEIALKLQERREELYHSLIKKADDKIAFEQTVNEAGDMLLLIDDGHRSLATDLDAEQIEQLLSIDNAKINFLLNEEFESGAFHRIMSTYFKDKTHSHESEWDI